MTVGRLIRSGKEREGAQIRSTPGLPSPCFTEVTDKLNYSLIVLHLSVKRSEGPRVFTFSVDFILSYALCKGSPWIPIFD